MLPYVAKRTTDVSKLRILRWVDYPGLSEWVLHVITSILTREWHRRVRQKAVRDREDRRVEMLRY